MLFERFRLYIFLAASSTVGLCSVATAQTISVIGLTGKEVQGELSDLGAQSVSVNTDSGAVSIPSSEISRLSVVGNDIQTSSAEPVEVGLVDGSVVVARNIASSDKGWRLDTSLLSAELTIPKDLFSSVRFKDLSESTMRTWKELLSAERSSDVLTVVRNDELESLNGAILNVTAEAVEFEMDGQTIQAPRAKVAGLIWLRRNTSGVVKAMDLVAKNGSRFRLKNVKLTKSNADAFLEIETIAGFQTRLPLNQAVRIDYSAANLQWLDQLQVLESVASLSFSIEGLADIKNKLMAPKFLNWDRDSDNAEGDTSRSNLVFEGPGRFVFRVPDGYTRLSTVIQRKQSARVLTPLVVTIKCDDKVVWSQKLEGEAMRLDVETKVEPNKKCEITVHSDAPIAYGSQTILLHPHLLP